MKSLEHISCVNTNSEAEFGNKVQSCGTEDAKIFYCYTLELVCCIIQVHYVKKYNFVQNF